MKKNIFYKKTSLLVTSLYMALLGIVPPAFGDELVETAPLFNGTVQGGLTLGFSFTVGSSALEVTALGVWNANWATPNSTLTNDHLVGIWSSSGSLLANTTLVAGTGTLVGEYLYANLSTPITLSANTQYYTGVSYNVSDVDQWGSARTGATFSSAASNFFATLALAPDSAPTTDALIGAGSIYGAPNLIMTTVVPEPSTLAFLLGGFSAVACATVLKKRRNFIAPKAASGRTKKSISFSSRRPA